VRYNLKVGIIAMFATVDLQTNFRTLYVNLSTINLRKKFLMPTSDGSSVLATEQKAEDNFQTPDMLIFYILQKITLTEAPLPHIVSGP
jgi:hypothetical protein